MRRSPDQSRSNVREQELPSWHPSDSRDQRHHGSQDRNEPAKRDAVGSVTREEPVRALHQSRPSRQRPLSSDADAIAKADPVRHKISRHRAEQRHDQKRHHRLAGGGGGGGDTHQDERAGHESANDGDRLDDRCEERNRQGPFGIAPHQSERAGQPSLRVVDPVPHGLLRYAPSVSFVGRRAGCAFHEMARTSRIKWSGQSRGRADDACQSLMTSVWRISKISRLRNAFRAKPDGLPLDVAIRSLRRSPGRTSSIRSASGQGRGQSSPGPSAGRAG